MLKKFLKEYFSFSKSEKQGVFTLLGIIVILLIIQLLPFHSHKRALINYYNFKNDIESFKDSLRILKKDSPNYNNVKTKGVNKLFYFNPNSTSKENWRKLGLNNKQINTIYKYLSKGGKFYKKEDLKKIFGIEDDLYNKLHKFIIIEKTDFENLNYKKFIVDTNYIKQRININSANAVELKNIYGIGNVFSDRIIKFRTSLGGFISLTQLKEVYGINDSTYNILLRKVKIDTLYIRKINLNTCDAKTLNNHPYISAYQANAIIRYRQFNNGFNSIDEIIKNNLLPTNIYNKVKGYFELK